MTTFGLSRHRTTGKRGEKGRTTDGASKCTKSPKRLFESGFVFACLCVWLFDEQRKRKNPPPIFNRPNHRRKRLESYGSKESLGGRVAVQELKHLARV